MDNIRGSVRASGSPRQASTPTPAPVSSGAPQTHPAPSTSSSRSKKPKSKRGIIALVVVAVLVIVAVAGFFVYRANSSTQIDSSKYQAIVLTSGESYFGKLEIVDDEFMKIKNVFYIQKSASEDKDDAKDLNSTEASQNSLQLIKLGNEVYGPEDEIMIARDQVIYFVNMKSDSKVTQTIEQYLNKK